MPAPQVIEKYEGDTFEFEAELVHGKAITDDQWAGAAAALVIMENVTRAPVNIGGSLTIDLLASPWKVVKLADGQMPAAGFSYLFRVTVTYLDGTVITYPGEHEWNVLRVAKGPG